MFEDLSLFAMAKRSMNWLSRRSEVLAENIANANTPRYQSKDLAPLSFKQLMEPDREPVRAVTTDPRHISPRVEPVRFETVTDRQPVESKPDGNDVQLEDQMNKVGDVKDDYALASNLYQYNLTMLKTAIGSQ